MKNTIKHKENRPGQFSTLSNSARRDKRLTGNSKILLMEILSDTEKFSVSQTLYMDRLGITKVTFLRCIKQLEEFGYIKRTKRETNTRVLLYDYEVTDISTYQETEVLKPSEPKVTQSIVKEEISSPTQDLKPQIESKEVVKVEVKQEVVKIEIPTVEIIKETILDETPQQRKQREQQEAIQREWDHSARVARIKLEADAKK